MTTKTPDEIKEGCGKQSCCSNKSCIHTCGDSTWLCDDCLNKDEDKRITKWLNDFRFTVGVDDDIKVIKAIYSAGVEEGKKQPKLGRKVVYNIAYKQASDDIIKMLYDKYHDFCYITGGFNMLRVQDEIRKLEEGQQ